MKKSLAALTGSLLNVGTMPEAKAPPDNYQSQVSLQQVTAFLAGPLVRVVTGKDPRGLVPIAFKATGCLLIPAGAGKTMISLEGSDTEEKFLSQKLTWEGSQNTFGPFKTMLAQQTAGDDMPLVPAMDSAKWKTQYPEETSNFGVEMIKSPIDDRFWEMEPSQFTPPKEAPESGAPLALLPRPFKPATDATKEK
jgi:hypothetical protein